MAKAKKVRPMTEEALALVARRFAVLSEPMRLRLLHALFDGEKPVNALVEATGGTQANVSRHLQNLADAGLLARRKEGLQVFYSIADPAGSPVGIIHHCCFKSGGNTPFRHFVFIVINPYAPVIGCKRF